MTGAEVDAAYPGRVRAAGGAASRSTGCGIEDLDDLAKRVAAGVRRRGRPGRAAARSSSVTHGGAAQVRPRRAARLAARDGRRLVRRCANCHWSELALRRAGAAGCSAQLQRRRRARSTGPTDSLTATVAGERVVSIAVTGMAAIAVVTDSTAYLPADVAADHWSDRRADHRRRSAAATASRASTSHPADVAHARCSAGASRSPRRGRRRPSSRRSTGACSTTAPTASSRCTCRRSCPAPTTPRCSPPPTSTARSRSSTAGRPAWAWASRRCPRAAAASRRSGSCRRYATPPPAAVDRTTVLFYVDSLEYLRRGGRIGAASALLGTALSVKPILHMVDGAHRRAGQGPHGQPGAGPDGRSRGRGGRRSSRSTSPCTTSVRRRGPRRSRPTLRERLGDSVEDVVRHRDRRGGRRACRPGPAVDRRAPHV